MDGDTDPVLEVRPREDVGAQTLARYRYQAEVAARSAFAMLDRSIRAILCEWHEDHVVFYQDGLSELVSVKHREPNQGPWRLTVLVSDGVGGDPITSWKTEHHRPSRHPCGGASTGRRSGRPRC